jgi:hypothetical protein
VNTRLAALASALALAVGTSGCEDNLASIQIQTVCAPTEDCTFTGECDAQYISWPTLDVAASARDAMALYLEVQNQMPDNSDPAINRTNTNDAHVDETVIEYDEIALPRVLVRSNFWVPAGGSSVFKVEVIPDALQAGATLGAFAPTAEPREMVARLRMRGYLDDGTRFETGEFPVLVRVCSGCVGLQCAGGPTCPPDSDGQLPIACVTP